MHIEINVRSSQVDALAETGQGRAINLMTLSTQKRRNLSPAPATVKCTVNENHRCHATAAATAPDDWEGLRVNFGQTFFGLITSEMAGTDDPALLGLINLEAWGAPISRPTRDPNNCAEPFRTR
jgi:hypothetical protein